MIPHVHRALCWLVCRGIIPEKTGRIYASINVCMYARDAVKYMKRPTNRCGAYYNCDLRTWNTTEWGKRLVRDATQLKIKRSKLQPTHGSNQLFKIILFSSIWFVDGGRFIEAAENILHISQFEIEPGGHHNIIAKYQTMQNIKRGKIEVYA